ncbi:hypothetical protein ACGFR8_07705 [Streptomyces brevispora]|uniref:hypothetical protein n=1 Tax=Streptomyces brevispora TaxID=887462 RepID=UPI003722C76C
MTEQTPGETKLAMIDGRDALAYVIIRPGTTEGSVLLEAAASGLDKAAGAYILRNIADLWDEETAMEAGAPDTTGPSAT